MCVSINYQGKTISSQYELKKAVGKKNVVYYADASSYQYNGGKMCLCPIDLSKTAENVGCKFECDTSRVVGYFVSK